MMNPVDTFVFESLAVYYQVSDYRVLDEIIDFQGTVFDINDFVDYLSVVYGKDYSHLKMLMIQVMV